MDMFRDEQERMLRDVISDGLRVDVSAVTIVQIDTARSFSRRRLAEASKIDVTVNIRSDATIVQIRSAITEDALKRAGLERITEIEILSVSVSPASVASTDDGDRTRFTSREIAVCVVVGGICVMIVGLGRICIYSKRGKNETADQNSSEFSRGKLDEVREATAKAAAKATKKAAKGRASRAKKDQASLLKAAKSRSRVTAKLRKALAQRNAAKASTGRLAKRQEPIARA